jgi:hypothetical protein
MSNQAITDELAVVLQALSNWPTAEQIEYTIIGGVAVSLTVKPRYTQDINAVVWLADSPWDVFLQSGATFGFVSRISVPLTFAQQSHILLLKHEATAIHVDLSLGAMPFEREMIERVLTVTELPYPIKVPTPEDLLITKTVASRPKDIPDIEAILQAYPKLDRKRAQYWVQAFAEALEMPELLEEFERLLQRIRPTNKEPASKSATKKKIRTKK